ncbi:LPS export ABC transporter ATP-binding protein [Truepera radiovictrix]|uniref:ABC transporter related protein n=1 Tax=Truepera radiovictrix (strain DSM 17093 / CIP 108686 / LMG 22925 / RQ-24) TaxID=649638 RepID=D7CRW4_TRURR|nr:LPS export ABC transporter ATP-binding protein [Truepera radiovictrix]ADI15292.1 ABC transporter related protein [Truepera radiovictrix DSM 17093]WMT56157.1 LPS export ABC transporter ATP-binding protein [Truepera radiovictrix]
MSALHDAPAPVSVTARPDRAAEARLSLEASGLVKRYGGRTVVNGVSFRLQRGEIVALLGPNGAGKTTSFYMMVGFVRPNAGRITLGGDDITRWPMYKRARRGLGYLAQEPSAFRKLSVRDNLMAILEFQRLSKAEQARRADELLAEFGLTHLADHRADTLSGGERRRLEIARSLTIEPAFILLDEPFTGVDPKSIREIQLLIADLRSRRGLGVLLTDHSVRETLSIADRVYLMYDGRVIFEGTPEAFAADEAVRTHYLGADFQL